MPDRGFLVVGSAPWPARRERRWLPVLLAIALGAAAGSALWLASRGRGHEPSRPVVSAIATPPTITAPAVTTNAPPTASLPASAPPAGLPAPTDRRAPAAEALPSAPRLPVPKPAAGGDAAAGLQLQAISERDGRPVAILSNRLVHEGDRFDGITVVRIGADEVEIEVQGRRRTLRF